MNGLDIFSGIGGLTKALEGYVTPVAYCENDRYAQAVLLSRMASHDLPAAPIWDDIKTLKGSNIEGSVEIMYGGFPCQDISCAGRGAGLAGERSGLFFEIARLIGEIRPSFVFLENVPALTLRGLDRIGLEFASLRYDCRWGILSASDVGANHERKRWWLLAHAIESTAGLEEHRGSGQGRRNSSSRQSKVLRQEDRALGSERIGTSGENVADAMLAGERRKQQQEKTQGDVVAHTESLRGREGKLLPRGLGREIQSDADRGGQDVADATSEISNGLPIGKKAQYTEFRQSGWWSTEPNVGRVAHGVPFRVDRLKGLGNAVVPAQAREAFERLMGLKNEEISLLRAS